MRKNIILIASVIAVILLILTLFGAFFVTFIFNRTQTIQCNDVNYEVIKDFEGQYFLARQSHPNINKLKKGEIVYYENELGVTEMLHILNTEKYGNISFIPNITLSSADFYNVKTCFSTSTFEYERNIIKKNLEPGFTEISGEICKNTQLDESNRLLFSDCSK